MQHRAVAAVRDWNARLGEKAVYLVCSHGDVIKAIVADALGLHLDQFQRITADPASLTVIRYTPLRPFVIRMNDVGGEMRNILPRSPQTAVRRTKMGVETSPRAMPRSAAEPGPRKVWVMPVFDYDPPERFVAGAVGQPGSRTFYLQARGAGRITTVGLEKFQVAVLADRLEELLDEVLRSSGGRAPIPAIAPADLTDTDPLDMPIDEEFRVGTIALAWDPETAKVVIEAQEADRRGRRGVPRRAEPAVLRVRISPGMARAFTKRAMEVVAAGRPPCPLCGQPLDPDGHICVRLNGHRPLRSGEGQVSAESDPMPTHPGSTPPAELDDETAMRLLREGSWRWRAGSSRRPT